MSRLLVLSLSLGALSACGGGRSDVPPAGAAATAATAGPSAPEVSPTNSQSRPQTAPMGGRRRELNNPEPSTIVFLYYDLAGLAPPIDQWVEEDNRVRFVPAIDKASHRLSVRAEFAAAAAAVREVGQLRITMAAQLTDYDPTYGEFTVRAFAPSMALTFNALGQKVDLHFSNGRDAQVWKVDAAQALSIRDRLGSNGSASADALLRITGVQPGPGIGTINVEVVEYELREDRTGTTLARISVHPT